MLVAKKMSVENGLHFKVTDVLLFNRYLLLTRCATFFDIFTGIIRRFALAVLYFLEKSLIIVEEKISFRCIMALYETRLLALSHIKPIIQ